MNKQTFALVGIILGFFCIAHPLAVQAIDRQHFAVEQSNNSIYFAASGWLGTTLVVAPTNPKSCSIYLDLISGNEILKPQFREAGFTEARCGSEVIDLQ